MASCIIHTRWRPLGVLEPYALCTSRCPVMLQAALLHRQEEGCQPTSATAMTQFPHFPLASSKDLLIHLEGRVRDRSSFYWFTPPNSHYGQGWARLKPGARSSIQASPMGGRESCHLLPRGLWISRKLELEADLRTKRKHCDLGCECQKQHGNYDTKCLPSQRVF